MGLHLGSPPLQLAPSSNEMDLDGHGTGWSVEAGQVGQRMDPACLAAVLAFGEGEPICRGQAKGSRLAREPPWQDSHQPFHQLPGRLGTFRCCLPLQR